MFSQKGRTMDVSSIGVSNSTQYLQRSQAGSQGPFNAIKQEEQAIQAIAQAVVQPGQQQAFQQTQTPAELAKSGVGQILDISA
ncbi:conserved hypothetical protein [Candidatus Terasakiella magnetica]|nr:conserved hypothetical protein [Candidatus Terasakiella magnetica]